MTLTELRYIVAVAREKHFGRAAEKCFVSQPTLSVAIRKLEDELGVAIFERASGEVTVTPLGEQIVAQAQRVMEETAAIKQIAAATIGGLADSSPRRYQRPAQTSPANSAVRAQCGQAIRPEARLPSCTACADRPPTSIP